MMFLSGIFESSKTNKQTGISMKTNLSSLFFDYSSKVEESINLRIKLERNDEEIALLKEEILMEPKLHEALTTVGVVHDKSVYKKIKSVSGPADFALQIEDYKSPVLSFQLDKTLGGKDE